ncbi:LIC_14007 family protein [Leptospira idonii]|uniref:Uncharacterized protein n=1 Tax=Leptospira idonii TaxID=1193500 RepID=A0A4R9LWD6_9LEPT|nr:hypothetical protein [Leptospira idonii]TGN18593.1 hypothetical protein EHS15_14520 [Leptospira idonii]
MSKTYSGERIPGTVNYHVFVNEGKAKRELLLDQRRKMDNFLPDSDLGLRNEVAYRISLAILFDYTGDLQLSESNFRDFKKNIERLISEDQWLIHSARIEVFLNQNDEEESLVDYSSFSGVNSSGSAVI